jgi:hypothetical protein
VASQVARRVLSRVGYFFRGFLQERFLLATAFWPRFFRFLHFLAEPLVLVPATRIVPGVTELPVPSGPPPATRFSKLW